MPPPPRFEAPAPADARGDGHRRLPQVISSDRRNRPLPACGRPACGLTHRPHPGPPPRPALLAIHQPRRATSVRCAGGATARRDPISPVVSGGNTELIRVDGWGPTPAWAAAMTTPPRGLRQTSPGAGLGIPRWPGDRARQARRPAAAFRFPGAASPRTGASIP